MSVSTIGTWSVALGVLLIVLAVPIDIFCCALFRRATAWRATQESKVRRLYGTLEFVAWRVPFISSALVTAGLLCLLVWPALSELWSAYELVTKIVVVIMALFAVPLAFIVIAGPGLCVLVVVDRRRQIVMNSIHPVCQQIKETELYKRWLEEYKKETRRKGGRAPRTPEEGGCQECHEYTPGMRMAVCSVCGYPVCLRCLKALSKCPACDSISFAHVRALGDGEYEPVDPSDALRR